MKRSKKLIFTFIILAVFILELFGGIVFLRNNDFNTKGKYDSNFSFVSQAEEPTNNKIGTLKGMISKDKKYYLLVSPLNIDIAQYKEIGYKITKGNDQSVEYSSNIFYTGVTVKNQTNFKTYTMQEIYPDFNTVGMIVKEIEYDIFSNYKIQPYIIDNENQRIDGSLKIINKSEIKLEAEDAQIVGISSNGLKDNAYLKENDTYYYNSSDKNTLIPTGEKAVCASYFDVNADENSITFKFNSSFPATVDLKMRMGNPYPIQNSDKSKEMHEYQINKNLQLYVNNNKVTISDDKKIEGFGHYPYIKSNTEWVRLFYVFFDVVIEDVNLVSGENTIKINFSKYVPSDDGLPSHYGDNGVIRGINFDYIVLQGK